MPSKVRAALRHILYHIDLAAQSVTSCDHLAFSNDLRTVYAVTRRLEIISQASRRLPDELKARHPPIPWNSIAGAGNIYRHDDEDIAARYVGETTQRDLPILRNVTVAETARP
jgi:uncharacterized protein with HEPN domain